MFMAMQQHLAPRVIQVANCCGEPIVINKSILAGCRQSVPMTRAIVYRMMNKLCKDNPGVTPKVYVDDTSFIAYGKSNVEVYEKIAKSQLQFHDLASKLGFKFSDKSAIVASSNKMGRQLQKEFLSHGLKFEVKSDARGLGITFTAGVKKPKKC